MASRRHQELVETIETALTRLHAQDRFEIQYVEDARAALASLVEQYESVRQSNESLKDEARHALETVRAECDLPDYIADIGDVLAPSNESVRESEKTWGPERMRHDPA